VPRVHEARWDVCARCEHKASEVRHSFVVHDVDGSEDNQANEGDAQCAYDVKRAFAEEVAAVRYAQENDEADGVGRHGP
jgi:hypothetical protein